MKVFQDTLRQRSWRKRKRVRSGENGNGKPKHTVLTCRSWRIVAMVFGTLEFCCLIHKQLPCNRFNFNVKQSSMNQDNVFSRKRAELHERAHTLTKLVRILGNFSLQKKYEITQSVRRNKRCAHMWRPHSSQIFPGARETTH